MTGAVQSLLALLAGAALHLILFALCWAFVSVGCSCHWRYYD